MHLGETVSRVILEESCDSLCLAPKVPSASTWRTGCVLLISEKRECVAEGRVVMSSHLGKGQRCEQQSGQVSSPYLVEAAAERAIMSSRSGGISGRATGN